MFQAKYFWTEIGDIHRMIKFKTTVSFSMLTVCQDKPESTRQTLHHISRGIERKRIFQDDLDRDVFLSKMVKILPRSPWMIRKVIFREYFNKKSLNMTSVLRLTV